MRLLIALASKKILLEFLLIGDAAYSNQAQSLTIIGKQRVIGNVVACKRRCKDLNPIRKSSFERHAPPCSARRLWDGVKRMKKLLRFSSYPFGELPKETSLSVCEEESRSTMVDLYCPQSMKVVCFVFGWESNV